VFAPNRCSRRNRTAPTSPLRDHSRRSPERPVPRPQHANGSASAARRYESREKRPCSRTSQDLQRAAEIRIEFLILVCPTPEPVDREASVETEQRMDESAPGFPGLEAFRNALGGVIPIDTALPGPETREQRRVGG
jgi:hypothetical protein